jgi:hypothetical protein
MALFAALGLAGCGDIEIGPEPAGDDGAGGGESGGPICEAEPGESVVCIEPGDGGQCLDCANTGCDLFADGGGCEPADVYITCGPMPANGMCCYTYTSSGEVCDGRPFVVNGTARTAEIVARRDWAASLPGRGEDWARRGLDEHASIAAFAKFVLELLSVGAPADLVADAVVAMRDEVDHARLCFGLAGDAIGPGPLRTADLEVAGDLEAIAAATLVEGAIGETLAAVRAATEATTEEDPAVRRALRRIADDETRHAALAWRFVAWALQQDPQLRPVLARVLDGAAATIDPDVARGLVRPVWARVCSSNGVARSGQNPPIAARHRHPVEHILITDGREVVGVDRRARMRRRG